MIGMNGLAGAISRSARLGTVLVVGVVAACGPSGGPPAGGPPGGGRGALEFPVEVMSVTKHPLIYTLTAVGSVDVFERVQVTARVSGVVERVRFREGDLVKKDEVLVEIEPERYSLAVASAKAGVERAAAALADADASLARREQASANNPGLIPGEELETFRTRARSAAAEQLAAKTALEQAALNLRDALVRAPIGGIVQTRTVQTGQFVQPGTVLASMIRRDPMIVRFKVPEDEADPLETGMAIEFKTRGSGKTYRAKITLVSASADESSRMVPITAEVSGADAAELKPGAFAEVTISHGVPREVPVIPQTAIRPSERGFLAYVVEDGVAKERVLSLGMRAAGGGVEVKSGLEGGEVLVIRGSEALRTGVKVRVVDGSKKPGDPAPKDGAPVDAAGVKAEGGPAGPGERKEKSAP